MKICWDNLEKLRYNKKTGTWIYKTSTYYYVEKCIECHEHHKDAHKELGCRYIDMTKQNVCGV